MPEPFPNLKPSLIFLWLYWRSVVTQEMGKEIQNSLQK